MNLADKILNRARGHGRDWVFTPRHLADLGSRAAIDQALHRLVQQGSVQRAARGVYCVPAVHPVLGPLSPSPDAVAKAVAEASGYKLQVTPARAANLFGLSTQVPAKLTYLTDGRSRKLRIGSQVVQFKHASPRTLLGTGRPAGVAYQALRAVRDSSHRDQAVRQLHGLLDSSTKSELKRLAPKAPASLQSLIAEVAV
ncbi:MAG: DUF6088 family protein [Bryobacteraceae bacterium]